MKQAPNWSRGLSERKTTNKNHNPLHGDSDKGANMNSVAKYNVDPDYHAIMMYDPWQEQAENLGHELVMTKIDLAYETQMHKFWKQMYHNQVESISKQC